MEKLHITGKAGLVISTAVVLVIWAVLGIGVGLVQMYNTAGTPASGTIQFSGNVSNGELVNITNGASVYRFEFNTTGIDPPNVCLTANCIRVNVLAPSGLIGWNTSIRASGNLTAAINANATVAAIVSAQNTTNLTTLRAASVGIAGNSITLSDNSGNIATSSMSGGTDANATSSLVLMIAQLGVSLAASLAVMLRFFEIKG